MTLTKKYASTVQARHPFSMAPSALPALPISTSTRPYVLVLAVHLEERTTPNPSSANAPQINFSQALVVWNVTILDTLT